MTIKKIFFTLLLAAIICTPASLRAQITIGSGAEPSQWSLLDLDNSERVGNNEQPKALHLPRMTTDDRDALVAPVPEGERRELERGLMIFNIDDDCLEFWSGSQWISLCEGDIPPTGVSIQGCASILTLGSTKTLTAVFTPANATPSVTWSSSDPAVATVNANGVVTAVAAGTATITVTTTIGGHTATCDVTVGILEPSADSRVTASVRVIYDFQTLNLDAWVVNGANPTAWQWQVSEDNVNWTNVDILNAANDL